MGVSLRPLRQGLPRVPGGEPWPPPGFVELEDRPDFLAETAVDVDAASPGPAMGSSGSATESAPDAAEPVVTIPSEAASPPTEVRQVPLRRGLPRTPGGEPWPPAGIGTLTVSSGAFDLTTPTVGPAASPVSGPAVSGPAVSGPAVPGPAVPAPIASEPAQGSSLAAPATEQRTVPLRRGLPRTAGGEPWPPSGTGLLTVCVDDFDSTATATAGPRPTAESTTTERVPLRRGLPRTAGGEPWPPAGYGLRTVAVPQDETTVEPMVPAAQESPAAALPIVEQQPEVDVPRVSTAVPTPPAPASVAQPTVKPAAARPAKPAPRPTPRPATKPTAGTAGERQPFNLAAFSAKVVAAVRFPAVALVGAIAVVGGLFMLVRWLLGTDAMEAFLVRYPGEYALPEGAEPGFPAWVRWNHFLNMFFIILIIRSGLQSRYEKKPPAYWTPRWSGFGGGKKISISLWLHQMLDILWLLNGIVFITLLFVTGHWMRIVPTSWEVFPNALSAMLQYLSLDWPTENGWVNYNSLQQLMYFLVVFIAAPLAAATGLRMSGLWPSKAKRLSTLYPVELARAVHFPTMIFFVFFVITHVAMVFATGALKNLNHMFSGTDSTNWAGFWIFVAALTVIAVVWELVRPMILAPIANLLGNVSQR